MSQLLHNLDAHEHRAPCTRNGKIRSDLGMYVFEIVQNKIKTGSKMLTNLLKSWDLSHVWQYHIKMNESRDSTRTYMHIKPLAQHGNHVQSHSVCVCLPLKAAHLKQKQQAIRWRKCCNVALVAEQLMALYQSPSISFSPRAVGNGHLSRQKASNGALKHTHYSPAGHQAANFYRCCYIASLHQDELLLLWQTETLTQVWCCTSAWNGTAANSYKESGSVFL